jgi:hypothetical protein
MYGHDRWPGHWPRLGWRIHYPVAFGTNLVDELSRRWYVGFSALSVAGVLGCRSHNRLWVPLAGWSALNTLFYGWALTIGQFGANERYILPIVVPLFPLAGTWLAEKLRHVVRSPSSYVTISLVLLTGVLIIAGSTLISPHFPKKSFHQLLPAAWLVVVTLALASPRSRVASIAVFGLLFTSLIGSFHMANERARHARHRNAEWKGVIRLVESMTSKQVGVISDTDVQTTEAHLRVYSNNRIVGSRLTRLGPDCPSVMLVDPGLLAGAKSQGYETLQSFELTYGTMWLLRK